MKNDDELSWKFLLTCIGGAIVFVYLAVIVGAGVLNLWRYLT